MPARPTRAPAAARLLAAAALVLAASATLTGCRDGQGVQDEGPSSVSSSLKRPCGSHRPAPADTQRSFCATSVAQ
ncbi:hypothetical protein ACH4UM_40580 [Streptomyces sp. NPDC020801]|uniref:hypothetical protein n=1 Tax=unclassified Streptomyces TaxID=2593676 RepID=UPI0037B1E1C6